jgi:hypothetical protein
MVFGTTTSKMPRQAGPTRDKGRVNDVQQQIAVGKAAGARNYDVEYLFRRAPEIFAKAAEPEHRAIARAVALGVGGLTIVPGGRLVPGVVEAAPSAQGRRTPDRCQFCQHCETFAS